MTGYLIRTPAWHGLDCELPVNLPPGECRIVVRLGDLSGETTFVAPERRAPSPVVVELR